MSDYQMVGPIRAFGRDRYVFVSMLSGTDIKGYTQFADETGVGLEKAKETYDDTELGSVFIPYTCIRYIREEEAR